MVAEAETDVEIRSLQRVKESEELLARLYVVDTGEHGVGQRTIRAMMVMSVLAVVVLIATLFMRYNTFVIMREEVMAKRANLEASIQRRNNLFGNLVKLTLNHAALEHSVFAHTSDKRTEAMRKAEGMPEANFDTVKKALNDGNLGRLLAGDAGLGLSLGRLMAIVEQYPNIQSAETYKHMMSSLEDMENRIAERREGYNLVASTYNAEITKWPWDYLARLFNFSRAEYFQQSHDDTPVITPELFQQLLPLVKAEGAK